MKILKDNEYDFTCNHTYEEFVEKGGYNSEWYFDFSTPLFDDEVWKSCKPIGLEHYYVSNYARIYREEFKVPYTRGSNPKIFYKTRKPCIMKVFKNCSTVNTKRLSYLTFQDKEKTYRLHRVVCYIFKADHPDDFNITEVTSGEKNLVSHLTGNTDINFASELEWSNQQDNIRNENTMAKKIGRRVSFSKKFIPEIDKNAALTDKVEDYEANVSPRWFTPVDFEGEIWKKIDFAPHCIISNYGRFRRLKHRPQDAEMPHYTDSSNGGYFMVSINGRSYYVQKLVAHAFLEPVEGMPLVDHIDSSVINRKI